MRAAVTNARCHTGIDAAGFSDSELRQAALLPELNFGLYFQYCSQQLSPMLDTASMKRHASSFGSERHALRDIARNASFPHYCLVGASRRQHSFPARGRASITPSGLMMIRRDNAVTIRAKLRAIHALIVGCARHDGRRTIGTPLWAQFILCCSQSILSTTAALPSSTMVLTGLAVYSSATRAARRRCPSTRLRRRYRFSLSAH